MNCASCAMPFNCLQAQQCLKDYVDAPPQNWEDLCKRQSYNYRVSGQHLETTMHFPCPGCGAKDFMVMRIIECERHYNEGAVCKECQRGFRMPVTEIKCKHGHTHTTQINFFQTVGPDLPDWYKIPMPREQRGN